MSKTQYQRAQAAATAPQDVDFIDEADLLRRLPFSRRTALDLRKKGVIPFVRVGARILYHWPSVRDALLRRQGIAA